MHNLLCLPFPIQLPVLYYPCFYKHANAQEQTQWLSEEEQGLWQHQTQLEEREARIHRKENALKKREARLREMEELACEAHAGIVQCIEQETAKRLRENEEVCLNPSGNMVLPSSFPVFPQ